MIKELRWNFDREGIWDSGVYENTIKKVPYIELIIMEPSWWKSKPIPYKEVSDIEAVIR